MLSARRRSDDARARSRKRWLLVAVALLAAEPIAPAMGQNLTNPQVPSASNVRRLPDGTTVFSDQPPPSESEPSGPLGRLQLGGAKPVALRGWTFGLSGDLSELYTSNALGLGQGVGVLNGPDFDTRLAIGLTAHARGARFIADASYTLGFNYFARHTLLNQVTNTFMGLAQAAIVPEHFIVNAEAFASPTFFNKLGSYSALASLPVASGPGFGYVNAYGYTITPDFIFRLGDFAVSDTAVSQSGIFFKQQQNTSLASGPSGSFDTSTYAAMERFYSGTDFVRLFWSVSARASKTTIAGGSLEDTGADLDLKYAINRSFTLLGTVGYESFSADQQLRTSLNGAILLAGAEVHFGPQIEASARAGRQFNHPSYIGNLRISFSPRTILSGFLTDSVSTPVQNYLGQLGQLGATSQGAFFNTSYQAVPLPQEGLNTGNLLGFNPGSYATSGLNTFITRFRSASLSLVHQRDRTQYLLTGYRSIVDTLTVTPQAIPQETISNVSAGVSHNLTRATTISASTGYDYDELLGGHFTLWQSTLQVNYAFSQTTQFYAIGAYLHRLTSDAVIAATSPFAGNLTDGSVMIGIHHQFF